MTNSDATELTLHRIIKAPRAAVWAAWSDPEILATWWCPKPWTTDVGAFELRPGGAFVTTMRSPDGEGMPANGVFLDVVPQERIVFTSALAPGWRPMDIPDLPITAFFALSDSEGGTQYDVRVLHKDPQDCAKHRDMGFEQGWSTVIDQLEAVAQEIK